ncbi:MAG: hypothetical protein PHV49_04995, partial [Alistipes sp.]|nr:hypothetical protein [Alistipes sp.]
DLLREFVQGVLLVQEIIQGGEQTGSVLGCAYHKICKFLYPKILKLADFYKYFNSYFIDNP